MDWGFGRRVAEGVKCFLTVLAGELHKGKMITLIHTRALTIRHTRKLYIDIDSLGYLFLSGEENWMKSTLS